MYEIFEQALAEGDTILAMQARLEEVDSRTFSEDDEKSLIAFAWCLAEYNKDREKYAPEASTIVWSAKWIVDSIAANIAIPRVKVVEYLEQFKKLIEGYKGENVLIQPVLPVTTWFRAIVRRGEYLGEMRHAQ